MSKHHYGPSSPPGIARKAAGDLQQNFRGHQPAGRALPRASATPAPGAGTIQPAQPQQPAPMSPLMGGQDGGTV